VGEHGKQFMDTIYMYKTDLHIFVVLFVFLLPLSLVKRILKY